METEQLEQPNYYAVIPANVRYSSIPANAKLLYGEITALCNKEGFCWASDEYFGELYGTARETVNRWVKALSEAGFIKLETVASAGGKKRKIYLAEPSDEKVTANRQKSHLPSDKKVTTILQVNNTSNISTKVDRPEAEKYGKTEINNLFEFWEKTTGICIVTRITKNRYSANNLLKKYGYTGVTKLIEGVAQTQSDQYAPRISDFTDLQAKLNQLLVWGKRRKSQIVEVIS